MIDFKMKGFSISFILISVILAEVLAARIPIKRRGYAGQIANQPMYLVAAGNGRSAPGQFYVAPNYAHFDQSDDMNEEYTPSEEEAVSGLADYIPVTDENGATYLLHKSAIPDAAGHPDMMQPDMMQPDMMQPDDEENQILVADGQIEVLGGQIYDSKTGENTIVLPEDILDSLGEDDVLALVENPDQIANSRKLIIRRRRKHQSYSYMPVRRQQYQPKRPYLVRRPQQQQQGHQHQRKAAFIKFGPINVLAYPDGRRRVLLQ